MIQIGILLAIFGFGSLLLEEFGYEFRILSWADEMQPGFGIALGIVGLALAGAGIWLNQKKKQPEGAADGAFGAPNPGVEGQPGVQPHGGQYGAPQAGAQPPVGGQPAGSPQSAQQGPGFGAHAQPAPGQASAQPPSGQAPGQQPAQQDSQQSGEGPIQGPGFGGRS